MSTAGSITTSKKADRVLVVDSEPLILKVYVTQLSRFYSLDTVSSGIEALQLIQDHGPYAVLVTDLNLPDMDGGVLLSKVRQQHSDTVRVLLTANDRHEVIAQAINEGGIFQYLPKPCPSERLAKTIENAIERYHRTLIEKQFMTGAVNAAIQIQLDFLELMNYPALEKSRRIEVIVRYLVDRLSPPNGWMVNLAARLCTVGEAVPANLARGMSPPELGAKLLGRLTQLREIVELIRCQREVPASIKEVPISKRILPVAFRYDELVTGGMPAVDAAAAISLQAQAGEEKILEVLKQFAAEQSFRAAPIAPIAAPTVAPQLAGV